MPKRSKLDEPMDQSEPPAPSFSPRRLRTRAAVRKSKEAPVDPDVEHEAARRAVKHRYMTKRAAMCKQLGIRRYADVIPPIGTLFDDPELVNHFAAVELQQFEIAGQIEEDIKDMIAMVDESFPGRTLVDEENNTTTGNKERTAASIMETLHDLTRRNKELTHGLLQFERSVMQEVIRIIMKEMKKPDHVENLRAEMKPIRHSTPISQTTSRAD
ncbi:unnamed protein product, partial [Mesorhabditis spiculigera]